MNKHEMLEQEFCRFIFEKTGGDGKQAEVARQAFAVSDPPTIWQRVRKGERKLTLSEASALSETTGKSLSWILAQVEAAVEDHVDQQTRKSA